MTFLPEAENHTAPVETFLGSEPSFPCGVPFPRRGYRTVADDQLALVLNG
jgi:hypothetical protein